jgi:hypothetical protein
MIFLINTILGFVLAQLIDVLNRDKASKNSPQKFDLLFFLKDNRFKIIVSLLLSFSLSLAVWLNIENVAKLIGKDWTIINDLVYLAIGFAPELILQWIKKKYGFLQPKNVDEYIRK